MSKLAEIPAPSTTEDLILALHSIGCVCLDGPYILKSGIESPVYIDMRLIISFPSVMRGVVSMIEALSKSLSFSLVCGVPYTALPIASILSLSMNVPMIMRRKEAKNYGMKKIIEGAWDTTIKHRCLLIEDLVTSGLSVFETIAPINECGIDVSDIVVILDREQGGRANIEQRGCHLHSLLTINQVCETLERTGRITSAKAESVRKFVRENQVNMSAVTQSTAPSAAQSLATSPFTSPKPTTKTLSINKFARTLSYGDRASQCVNPQSKKLLTIMESKRTNLCLSADVTTSAELLTLATECGPYICMLKTHADCITDWTESLSQQLVSLADQFNFLLFEDRKFADIGNTVSTQYREGVHHISHWSHVVNCHLISGPGVVDGLRQGANDRASNDASGLLLIAEMSSEGALATGAYTTTNVSIAESEKYSDFIIGFICQHRLSSKPSLIHCTPGVALSVSGDSLGQQYNTPQSAIGERGNDVIIVGRAIYGNKAAIGETAKEFQRQGWEAYETSLNK